MKNGNQQNQQPLELLPYQQKRIDVIKSILTLTGEDYVLKGGTALLLYYGLNRFSEDVDLDSFSTDMKIIDKLKEALPHEWDIREKKNTETVYRIMIDYRETRYDAGAYPLKVEISSRNKEDLYKKRLKFSSIDGVNVYDIGEIKNMKVRTFGRRDKIRDLYDIGFLLNKYPEYFNRDDLLGIRDEINHKGWDELSTLLEVELKKHNLISAHIDPETYLLQIYERCDVLLDEIEKEKKPKGRQR